MSRIRFEATLSLSKETGTGIVLTLPKDASAKLPSRGMTVVEGTINEIPLQAVLEPDGKESHWFKVNESLLETVGARAGDTVALDLAPAKEWPEPAIPSDLTEVLRNDREAEEIWKAITPSARWDWIRWIGAAKQSETRKRRVESVCSRLRAGKRRPCCFDRSQCTLTEA